MMLVAFLIVGALWLATGSVRKARPRRYTRVLKSLVFVCAIGALISLGLEAPKVLVDWLVSFGFALIVFDALQFYQSRTQDQRAREEARLAEVDSDLKRMRDRAS
jgi:threonine/homoserine/homoserine lactone efflux protein